jgi:hypothetical protein
VNGDVVHEQILIADDDPPVSRTARLLLERVA